MAVQDTSGRVSDGLVGVVTLTNTVWPLVIEFFKKIFLSFFLSGSQSRLAHTGLG